MNIRAMTLPEISAVLKELNQPAFRAKQVYSWLHKGVTGYEEMTNVPASLRQQLQQLHDLMFCEVNPMPVKAAMQCIGYDCGGCRLPLCGLTKEHQAQIERHFT